MSPFPVNVILFISNAMLCIGSCIQILTSGIKAEKQDASAHIRVLLEGNGKAGWMPHLFNT
jgi:hypothetical protein